MKQQAEWAARRTQEYEPYGWLGSALAFSGRVRSARDLYRTGVEVALRRQLNDPAAQLETADALVQAETGNCLKSKEASMRAIALSHEAPVVEGNAIANALCGAHGGALALAADLSRRYPKSTLVHEIWMPVIRAAAELRRANPEATPKRSRLRRPSYLQQVGRRRTPYSHC